VSAKSPMPHAPLDQPSPWVARFLALAPAGGRVLDLAAGGGRHARLARARGYTATAVDIDVAALADLRADAGVEILAADLEGADWPLGDRRFAAVIVTNYLHRPLLPNLVAAVDEGGVLIYETFAAGNEAFGKPSNPNFLLQPGELLDAVRGTLTVVAYEHGEVRAPRPAVIQRIAAVRDRGAERPRALPPALS
jgi:SAM-dependent methyltransferase